MNVLFLSAYNCLERVSLKGESLESVLADATQDAPFRLKRDTEKLVRGVTEQDKVLQKTLDAYAKSVKPKIKIILKMGLFCFDSMTLPPYTVVNDLAELTKLSGKRQLVGFVNATLRSVLRDKENNGKSADTAKGDG